MSAPFSPVQKKKVNMCLVCLRSTAFPTREGKEKHAEHQNAHSVFLLELSVATLCARNNSQQH